ncbi:MAG TPA: TolC family protein [Ignavibacteriaceae bacterium]|nr:TolC family protein [Ignavibacteriaceae bacterium]
MKFNLKNIFVLAFIFTAGTITAQQSNAQSDTSGAGRVISLNEALQIGIQNSEELHASNARVLSAEARIGEVNADRLPSLSFNAAYMRLSKVEPFTINAGPLGTFDISSSIPNNYNLQLSLRQPVFTGFRLLSSSRIAEYNFNAAQEEFTGDKQQLVLNIKSAYWGLFKANKIKQVVDENVQQVNAHLTDVKNMFNEGLVTRNDMLKVQVQLDEAKLRQIDADNAVKLSKINLNNIIGFPVNADVQTVDTIAPEVETVKTYDQLLETAYEKRPELRALDYRVKASETGIKLAQSSWYPQVYLIGDYNYARPNTRIFPVQDKFKDTWDVGVQLSFNIWNWNKTGNQTTQAEMQYEQTKDSYKSLKDAVALDISSNYLNLVKAKERLSVTKLSVEQAEENYKVTNDLFKQGLTLNSELIDAEVALLTAKTNQVQSLVDYELAKANLEKSIGEMEMPE